MGLDYSTHAAFAASSVVSFGWLRRGWLVPWIVSLVADFALAVLMEYHGPLDLLTAALLVATLTCLTHVAIRTPRSAVRRALVAGGLAMGGATVAATALAAPASPGALVIWPGYSVELPRDHCVDVHKGPDFDVLYVRRRESKQEDFLLAIYAGYAPKFAPDCSRPTTRKWTASGLSFESVRGAEGCAEFLVRDPTSTERGSLHLWFGPAAAERGQTAERLLASVRPVPLPVKDATAPPACPTPSPPPK